MKIRFNPIALLYIFLVYLEVATDRQKIFPVTYMSKYYIGILIIILFSSLLIVNRNKVRLNKQLLFLSKILSIPILVTFFYSLFLLFLQGSIFEGYSSRLIGMTLYGFLALIQAMLVFQFFGGKAVTYTFSAIGLSYLTSVFVAYKEGGLSEFILMITDSGFNGSVLEMHEVAPIVALFILYYLYRYFYRELRLRQVVPPILIGIMILLLSMKRIVLLSIFLIIPVFLLIYWYNQRQKRLHKEFRTLRLMNVMSVIFLCVTLSYVAVIKSGYIYTFIQEHNINSMSRSQLWLGIVSAYDFNITYWGHGIGFVSKWMDNTWMNLDIIGLTGTTGLHNDILKFYVELGFLGTILYFYNYLYLNSKLIFKQFGVKQCILYFILMLFQMLNWFTDNISIYHNFQWIFYLFLFSLVDSKYTENNRIG